MKTIRETIRVEYPIYQCVWDFIEESIGSSIGDFVWKSVTISVWETIWFYVQKQTDNFTTEKL